jgi:hypothetical protein
LVTKARKEVIFMQEEIKYIQNTLWAMWKEFQTTFSVRTYTEQAVQLVHKYDGQRELQCFVQNLVICWTPIINMIAEEHRKEVQS